MTFKTLSYIHNCLINAENSARLKLKWFDESDYLPALDDLDDNLISKFRFEEIKAQRDQLREEHCAAYDALCEFEDKQWQ